MSRVHAIITAAGSSSRMGGVDKLLLPLHGIPLLVRTLEPFVSFPRMNRVVVAVNPERVDEFRRLFLEHFPGENERILVTTGGTHRQESILLALRSLVSQVDSGREHSVMIHDGARPFVTAGLFNALLDCLESFDGAIPALPVRDTVKRVEGNRVIGTLDRETLRLVQTPQVFTLQSILDLHQRAHEDGFVGTDDASLLERYGGKVGWIDGPIYNLKVTVPEDIPLLSHLFRERNKVETT